MSRPITPILRLLPALLVGLAGCGGPKTDTTGTSGNASVAPQASLAQARQARAAPAPNIADGPDACFRAVARHLGADAKVSEITSFFSSGSEIDSSDTEPKGAMTLCNVDYQNPNDPRKLLNTSLDVATGQFSSPRPVEITVSGGDAARFKLDDYVIPLSAVNAAGLGSVMEGQKGTLASVYSRYAWSGVRLEAPDPFSSVHTLRLDVDGRLASNDVKEGGYASISTDGKKITRNYLKP